MSGSRVLRLHSSKRWSFLLLALSLHFQLNFITDLSASSKQPCCISIGVAAKYRLKNWHCHSVHKFLISFVISSSLCGLFRFPNFGGFSSNLPVWLENHWRILVLWRFWASLGGTERGPFRQARRPHSLRLLGVMCCEWLGLAYPLHFQILPVLTDVF